MTRNSYLGGADAAAVLGRHLYRSRLAVWLAKRGKSADTDLSENPHVQRGNFLESYVETYIREKMDPTINNDAAWAKYDAKQRAERRIPERSPDAQIMLLDTNNPHPITGKPYVGGHPDGIGDEILYEIKCPTTRKVDRIVREGAPAEWLFQVQHYLRLTGLALGKMVIWNADDWAPYVIDVHADLDLHEIMREEYETFWNHVANGTEPTDGSKAQDHQVHVNTDPEIEKHLREYKEAYNGRYEFENVQKRVRAQLLTAAQGRNCLITPSYTATINRRTNRYGTESTILTVSQNAAAQNDETA